MALVAQRLLGTEPNSDPVWPLLTRLAGRGTDDSAGQDFQPPAEWRLPPAWLAPFSGGTAWTWAVAAGCLRVEHPEGFCVLDLAQGPDDPSSRLQLEMQTYAAGCAAELRQTLVSDGEQTRIPLERWLGWLVPYLRARLVRALGLTDAAELPALFFARRARVFVTASRLDVVFNLAELPIAVRLAGLDRDPDWVPAAGRVIAFHFE